MRMWTGSVSYCVGWHNSELDSKIRKYLSYTRHFWMNLNLRVLFQNTSPIEVQNYSISAYVYYRRGVVTTCSVAQTAPLFCYCVYIAMDQHSLFFFIVASLSWLWEVMTTLPDYPVVALREHKALIYKIKRIHLRAPSEGYYPRLKASPKRTAMKGLDWNLLNWFDDRGVSLYWI